MPYVNANWQMTAAAGHAPPPPPDTQHYGYFAPGFSQPFYQAESNAMMYPTHQPLSGVQGYHHHPCWSSLVSSTGSIGSVGSSGHSSSMRRRSTKRQVKKKHHNMANSVETRYDGETLFSMQSKLCFGTLVVPSRIFRHYVTKPWSWRQVELSVSQRIRKVLGSYSSASNVLIKMRSNWCLMKPSLRLKVIWSSGSPSTIVLFVPHNAIVWSTTPLFDTTPLNRPMEWRLRQFYPTEASWVRYRWHEGKYCKSACIGFAYVVYEGLWMVS